MPNIVGTITETLDLFWKISIDIAKCPIEATYPTFIRLLPGPIGRNRRRAYFKDRFQKCGKNLIVLEGVRVIQAGLLSVGESLTISYDVIINAGGGLSIGDDVMIGPGTKIWTINHNFNELITPIREQGWTGKSVHIGNDVWIAAGCIILPGAEIGDHSVIGAGSVVTDKLPPYSIAAGNPARVLKKRKGYREHLNKKLEFDFD